jgi:hypothetical protein
MRILEQMPPCHVTPFVQPGVLIAPTSVSEERSCASPEECCDYCGSIRLEWRKCKLICGDCRQINKSCADL